jgi:hypothetical protein
MNIRTLSLLLLLWLALTTRNAAESEATAKDEGKPMSEASPDNQIQHEQQQQQCSGNDETCQVRIVTIEELATKSGEDGGKELWLSILGRVYNVSNGPGESR